MHICTECFSPYPPPTAAAPGGAKIVSHPPRGVHEPASELVQKTIKFSLALADLLFSGIRLKELCIMEPPP